MSPFRLLLKKTASKLRHTSPPANSGNSSRKARHNKSCPSPFLPVRDVRNYSVCMPPPPAPVASVAAVATKDARFHVKNVSVRMNRSSMLRHRIEHSPKAAISPRQKRRKFNVSPTGSTDDESDRLATATTSATSGVVTSKSKNKRGLKTKRRSIVEEKNRKKVRSSHGKPPAPAAAVSGKGFRSFINRILK